MDSAIRVLSRRAAEPPPASLVDPGFAVDDSDLSFLAEHGYVLPGRRGERGDESTAPFLTGEGLAWCRRNIDGMIADLAASQPDRTPDRMVNQHQAEGGEWLWELVSHPLLVEAAVRQIGPDVICWSTHLLIKTPGTGPEIPWHQVRPLHHSATTPITHPQPTTAIHRRPRRPPTHLPRAPCSNSPCMYP
eukprot:COSAG04_NODE_6469_length_1320_cov_1.572482_2_plen_190_part_00